VTLWTSCHFDRTDYSVVVKNRASLQERPMRNYRFGRNIKLPATIAIKHQLRMLMAQDEAKKAEADARAEASRRQRREELLAK
jgi:hypothetical protein